MEPGSLAQHPSPEMGPKQTPETAQPSGNSLPMTTEKPAVSVERGEAQPQPSAGPGAPVVALPQLPTLPSPQQPTQSAQPVTTDNNPVQAADDDIVEKEWVDKAKKIVAQTKDDPYNQEKEVSKLQADYLKKRYGKELKLSSE